MSHSQNRLSDLTAWYAILCMQVQRTPIHVRRLHSLHLTSFIYRSWKSLLLLCNSIITYTWYSALFLLRPYYCYAFFSDVDIYVSSVQSFPGSRSPVLALFQPWINQRHVMYLSLQGFFHFTLVLLFTFYFLLNHL